MFGSQIPDLGMLDREVRAWTIERDVSAVKVNWQVRTVDVRVKLASLYPSNVS